MQPLLCALSAWAGQSSLDHGEWGDLDEQLEDMSRTRTMILTHTFWGKKGTTYALMSHKVPINGTGLARGERGEVRLFKCCFFSSWWAETVMTVRGSVYNCMCISYLNGISSLFIYRLPWDMYAPWWQRVPGHHWGYFEIPTIPICLQTIICRGMFFLGLRGPLVEPSILHPSRPVHPSATIFPEFIYTGIHALWIIRSLIKPTRWHKGIP